jgi:hypothetical protein
MSDIRSKAIRTAAALPKGSSERKALQDLLGAPKRKLAALPRATRRPAGPKFRQKMNEWIKSDTQSKLEAGGVAQRTIDNFIRSLTDDYGPMRATSYSGGYGSNNYRNFEDQQAAVDWLAGKTSLEQAPGGALGMKRYTKIHEAIITKYGAGNDAIRDKAKGLANKMKPHQKALALMVIGVDKGSFPYKQMEYVKDLDDRIARSGGDVLQALIPFLEWALKVPVPPKN